MSFFVLIFEKERMRSENGREEKAKPSMAENFDWNFNCGNCNLPWNLFLFY